MGSFAVRVKETTTTTGTGALSLLGAVAGHQTFVAGHGTTKPCPYVIEVGANGQDGWEAGIGTPTSGSPDQLSRDLVLYSTNGNAAINLPSGVKTVFSAALAHVLPGKGADVASASTLELPKDGDYAVVTGTTGITRLKYRPPGTHVRLRYAAAAPLTHHATYLILQGAANWTPAAGDLSEFVSEGGTVADPEWRESNRHTATVASAVDQIARDNTVILRWKFAQADGLTRFAMINTFEDTFTDEVGVDGAGSTNETYYAAGDYYHNPGGYSADQIPAMTTNTAPAGVASASSEFDSTYLAFEAMDDSNAAGSGWGSDSADSQWLQYQFASSKAVTKLTMRSQDSADYTRCPRGFTLKASNTGSFTGEEATLLTVAETGAYWAQNEQKVWTFSNSTAYTYYRITMTDKQDAFGKGVEYVIGEIELMINQVAANMTLLSNAVTAASAPTSLRIYADHEQVDARS